MPLELCFEPRRQRYSAFLVWGCVHPNCASETFRGLFGAFLGHIVGLEGTKGLFDTKKSGRSCSPLFGCFERFYGRFGAETAVFAPPPPPQKKHLGFGIADLGVHLLAWCLRPGLPSVSCFLKILISQGQISFVASRSSRGLAHHTTSSP